MKINTLENLIPWLAGLDLEGFAKPMADAGWLGDKLLDMTREDMADLGIPRQPVDSRGLLELAIRALREDSGNMSAPGQEAPCYSSELNNPNVIHRCQLLATQPPLPWCEAAMNAWPAPIAHEYHRLRELLANGQLVSAIFQLKDLAEILVKFPALIMARDLIAHGDQEAAMAARRCLLGSGRLLFGDWMRSIKDSLAPQQIRLAASDALLLPELAGLFITTQGRRSKPTEWLNVLGDLVHWRNTQLAHGAFRLDPTEYLADLETYIGRINQQFALQDNAGIWHGMALVVQDHGGALNGWQAIRHEHQDDSSEHREDSISLHLRRDGRELSLAPYVCLRRCHECGMQDVFIYDTRTDLGIEDGFRLIDFMRGHALRLSYHSDQAFANEAKHLQNATEPALPSQVLLSKTHVDLRINELLEAKSLDARYLSPVFLRRSIKEFLESHASGVFWLTAPGHVGKSVFVRGLADPETVGEACLLPGTAIVAFHIKREYRFWLEQCREWLKEAILKNLCGLGAGREQLPELNTKATDPQAALIELLYTYRELMRRHAPQFDRLLLCFDGLDEVPTPENGEHNLLAFLPEPQRLPEGIYLLLTSRPLEHCCAYARSQLASRYGENPHYQHLSLTPNVNDPAALAYQQLLRDYFQRELKSLIRTELSNAFENFVNQHAQDKEISCSNDLKIIKPLWWQNMARKFWQEASRNLKMREPQNAPSLAHAVVIPVMTMFEDAFQAASDRADGRFLYLAHINELIANHHAGLDEIVLLPHGSGLFAHYLSELERTLSSGSTQAPTKPWDFVKRLILSLAVAEQAHIDIQALILPGLRDPDFNGVPLSILAALLEEPEGSVRLTFTLYSLKEILSVWKGDSNDARYALGLKGLLNTVQALWPDAIQARRNGLLGHCFETLDGRWKKISIDNLQDLWRVEYVVAWCHSSEPSAWVNHAKDLLSCIDSIGCKCFLGYKYIDCAIWDTLAISMVERYGINEFQLKRDFSMNLLRTRLPGIT